MNNTLLRWGILALLSLTACQKETSSVDLLRISPTIQSRATALHFERGDCIGLTIQRTSGTYVENEPLTYDGSSFSSAQLRWYASSDAATLRAYYPFRPEGVGTRFTIACDQRTELTSSDLLAASRTAVTPTAEAVTMTFYHLLSRLQIAFHNQSSASVRAIELDGLITTAAIDWEQLTASAVEGEQPTTLHPFVLTAGENYQAILVPQETTLTLRVVTDAATLTKQFAVALQSGKTYTLTLTLDETSLACSIAGDIHDWNDGGELAPEEEEEENPSTPDEEDASQESLTIGNENYTTCIVEGRRWMAENLRNEVEGVAVGTGYWYPSNGEQKAGDASLVATHGYLYSYAVAATLCPAGWHLPSAEELESLRQAAPANFFCTAGMYTAQTSDGTHNPNSYLLGTLSEEDNTKCYVLQFTNEGATTLKTLTKANGYSVRCVADK